MYSKDWHSFRDIREIWDAIEEEYNAFPEKYRQEKGKRGISTE